MWPRRAVIPPWGLDALLGCGVALVVSLVISADYGGRQSPDLLAYLWAVGLGALMLARRRHPTAVLAVTALGLFAYYAAGYPAVGLAVPVAAALFSAAETGRLASAIVTAVTVTAVSLLFRLVEGQEASFVLGYDLVPHVTLMAAAIALGDSVRGRRVQRAQQQELADLTARRRTQEALRRAHAERLAIARDLHDSIGHTVSVISLHADVAREAVERDPDQASAALRLVKESAAQTMRELRTTVSMLREPGDAPERLVSLSNIETLTETARVAGLDVETEVEVSERLPGTVDAAAYRIIQEAVTNVTRHSAASSVRVTAVTADGRLRLVVSDDGPARSDGPGGEGHGLRGMAERARGLGGTFAAGRDADGFTVRAELPLAEAS